MDDNERNRIKTFDCHGDQNTLGLRWKRWLTAFELFADGKGLTLNEDNATNRQRRRALMLHLAGPDVQDIFLTLPNTGDVKDYRKAVDALNAYFAPKVDTTYARHCFRQLVQAPGKQSDSLQPDSDEHRKIVTMAKTQITKFVIKSSTSAPAGT